MLSDVIKNGVIDLDIQGHFDSEFSRKFSLPAQ